MCCLQAAFGVQPGTHVTVKNTSEVLHLTLAYSAVSSVVAAIAEWRDLRGAQVRLKCACVCVCKDMQPKLHC